MVPLPLTLVDEAAQLIARAFFHDPLYRFFFPCERKRIRKIQALYRFILREHIRHVWMSSEILEGVVIWEEPYDHGLDIGLWAVKEGFCFFKTLGVVGLVRVVAFAVVSFFWRRKFLREEDFCLTVIAVDPSCQGKGIGKKMLFCLLTEADKNEASVYLETQNPSNVGLYERFGFVVVGKRFWKGGEHVMMRRRG
ncbi:GNAT family N-acetyltransferase [Thermospira aquatica]|uniref:GNAT family N-acetyltransferase n=1 Tax=Thermospira aquatica TaxID=2828656 RepID=A0AAX3BGB7_9SPIR|nr:GNAT family N-acetyltransferase [Thermospira aquatica]URA11153.1 GNAT family N-acetyltransferase [Thermospira aquatica]